MARKFVNSPSYLYLFNQKIKRKQEKGFVKLIKDLVKKGKKSDTIIQNAIQQLYSIQKSPKDSDPLMNLYIDLFIHDFLDLIPKCKDYEYFHRRVYFKKN